VRTLPYGYDAVGIVLVTAAARQSQKDLHNNRLVSRLCRGPASSQARTLQTTSECDIEADAWTSSFPNADGLVISPQERPEELEHIVDPSPLALIELLLERIPKHRLKRFILRDVDEYYADEEWGLHAAKAICSAQATAHLQQVIIQTEVTTEVADMLISSLKQLQKLHLCVGPSFEDQDSWSPAGSSSLIELELMEDSMILKDTEDLGGIEEDMGDMEEDMEDMEEQKPVITLNMCDYAGCSKLQKLRLVYWSAVDWEAVATLDHLLELSCDVFMRAAEDKQLCLANIAKLPLLERLTVNMDVDSAGWRLLASMPALSELSASRLQLAPDSPASSSITRLKVQNVIREEQQQQQLKQVWLNLEVDDEALAARLRQWQLDQQQQQPEQQQQEQQQGTAATGGLQQQQQQQRSASAPSLGTLARILPNLQSFDISQADLPCLTALLDGHSKLRSLTLMLGSTAAIRNDGPAVVQLLSSLPALEELGVCSKVARLDALLAAVAASCSKLRRLHCDTISSLPFTGKGLQALAAGLCRYSLQSLSLDLRAAERILPPFSDEALQELATVRGPELQVQWDWHAIAALVALAQLPSAPLSL
jgi:hypothetical protein